MCHPTDILLPYSHATHFLPFNFVFQIPNSWTNPKQFQFVYPMGTEDYSHPYEQFYEISPTPLGFGCGTASTPCSLMGHSTSSITDCLQEVHNIIRIGGCVFCPLVAQTGAFAVGYCCTKYWATGIQQLRPSRKCT